jgi:hypothetical protein
MQSHQRIDADDVEITNKKATEMAFHSQLPLFF